MNPFSLKSIVKSLAKGDLGALEILSALACHADGLDPWGRLVASGLVGAKLNVLWEVCDHDIEKVIHVLNNCQLYVLIDACNGNEYWGRKRLAEYLECTTWDNISYNEN